MRGTATQSPLRRERGVTDTDPEHAHASAELLVKVLWRSAVSSSLCHYLSTAVHGPLPSSLASGQLECALASPLHATLLSSAAGQDEEPVSLDAALLQSNARVTAWMQQSQSPQ